MPTGPALLAALGPVPVGPWCRSSPKARPASLPAGAPAAPGPVAAVGLGGPAAQPSTPLLLARPPPPAALPKLPELLAGPPAAHDPASPSSCDKPVVSTPQLSRGSTIPLADIPAESAACIPAAASICALAGSPQPALPVEGGPDPAAAAAAAAGARARFAPQLEEAGKPLPPAVGAAAAAGGNPWWLPAPGAAA